MALEAAAHIFVGAQGAQVSLEHALKQLQGLLAEADLSAALDRDGCPLVAQGR